MRVLVLLIAFAAAALAQNDAADPSIVTAGGNLNIRLPRDGSLLVESRKTIDVATRLDELDQQLENAKIFADSIAYNASLSSTIQLNSLVMNLETEVAEMIAAATKVNLSMTKALKDFETSINAQVDSTIDGMVTNLSKQLNSASAKADGTKTAITSSVNSIKTKISNQLNTVKTTVDANKPILVGWKECAQHGSAGADQNADRFYHYCDYTKKEDDTVLVISSNFNTRQINGNSVWKLKVDKQECRHRNGASQGDLKYRLHGSSSVNLHRPVHLKGACWKLQNGKTIAKGKHRVTMHQVYVSSDSYYGWDSTSRLLVQEFKVDETPTITPNPPNNGWR